MQNFKVGDWAVYKGGGYCEGEILQVTNIDEKGFCTFGSYNKLYHFDKLRPWKPQLGEWCWYSKWDKIICVEFYLCKFVLDMNEVEPEFKHKYEPFIGELPTFLKENT